MEEEIWEALMSSNSIINRELTEKRHTIDRVEIAKFVGQIGAEWQSTLRARRPHRPVFALVFFGRSAQSAAAVEKGDKSTYRSVYPEMPRKGEREPGGALHCLEILSPTAHRIRVSLQTMIIPVHQNEKKDATCLSQYSAPRVYRRVSMTGRLMRADDPDCLFV